MADKPFDQTIINLRERPVSADIDRAQSQVHRTIRDVLREMLGTRTSFTSSLAARRSAFVGDSFQVVPQSPIGMQVIVRPGIGFFDVIDAATGINGVAGLDDLSPCKPIVLMNQVAFTVPAAPAGPNTRVDIIEARLERRVEDLGNRDVLQTIGADKGKFLTANVYKTMGFTHDGHTGNVTSPTASTAALSYKAGVAANPGVAPGVTAGYIKIAEINVGSGVASIDDDAIIDRRLLHAPGGVLHMSAKFRLQYNAGTPIVTMKSLQTPAGCKFCVSAPAASARGEYRLFFLAGEMAEIVVAPHVVSQISLGIPEALTTAIRNELDVSTVSSGDQTVMAASTPSISAGIGQKCHDASYVTRYIADTGIVNNTNVILEDLTIHVHATIRY